MPLNWTANKRFWNPIEMKIFPSSLHSFFPTVLEWNYWTGGHHQQGHRSNSMRNSLDLASPKKVIEHSFRLNWIPSEWKHAHGPSEHPSLIRAEHQSKRGAAPILYLVGSIHHPLLLHPELPSEGGSVMLMSFNIRTIPPQAINQSSIHNAPLCRCL